jgi:hypothetical protein
MFEQLLSAVELLVLFDTFERLPRHPTYRYEYFGGQAVLTPRSQLSFVEEGVKRIVGGA